ncbi:uncharacterized protein LOC114332367 [Diabrotica virgifera virgifera]|uniref:Uncharacterized protein LOC114332367 n=1 Tax=Diabrotica virgifera virgifera TaxID=50390 RepID=A0A6P7FNN1_DIAVI|nr:uncharacterized protein LOC114332367 [Diabrotica virgifera virgifera]
MGKLIFATFFILATLAIAEVEPRHVKTIDLHNNTTPTPEGVGIINTRPNDRNNKNKRDTHARPTPSEPSTSTQTHSTPLTPTEPSAPQLPWKGPESSKPRLESTNVTATPPFFGWF